MSDSTGLDFVWYVYLIGKVSLTHTVGRTSTAYHGARARRPISGSACSLLCIAPRSNYPLLYRLENLVLGLFMVYRMLSPLALVAPFKSSSHRLIRRNLCDDLVRRTLDLRPW